MFNYVKERLSAGPIRTHTWFKGLSRNKLLQQFNRSYGELLILHWDAKYQIIKDGHVIFILQTI